MALRVLSWNMNHRASAWAYLRTMHDRHGTQIALLQEAVPPSAGVVPPWVWPQRDDRDAWRISVPPDAPGRTWCSAIACLDPDVHPGAYPPTPINSARDRQFAACHPGQFAVARLNVGKSRQGVWLISLYALWETMADSGDNYAHASLHRAISDLTAIFQRRDATHVVIAGDLNIYNGYGDWIAHDSAIFSRLASYGLELVGPFRPDGAEVTPGCPCGPASDCRHVQTYRGTNSEKPFQIDFMFASQAMREGCEVVVDPDSDCWTHSDHRPVLATFHV